MFTDLMEGKPFNLKINYVPFQFLGEVAK